MAYFKICLLTPRVENQQVGFIEDIMTEFDIPADYSLDLQTTNTEDLYENRDLLLTTSEQYAKHDTSYTYNEKVSFSQNGQKTLSFDLNRYIMKENEWVENPYSHLLTEGTQLLLTDQYHNEFFFTVVSTKFNIRENNIVYNISCQDSFSYQTTRQNDGYTINNDPNEDDFIGAKTIDWWVLKKIVPECHLANYTYLSCNTGLYEATDGSYKTFKYNEDIYNVKRIIKEAHIPPIHDTATDAIIQENDIDYFERVSFSCSGVNVDAALIQLGDQVNLQLDTFEHAQIINGQRTKYFDRYFWFEPKKNENRIGLTYSPSYNIKNFDLTYQGQSLTTVLNVNGPTYGDEIITLLPDVPEFFLTYFNSSVWEDSSYTPGIFTQLCKNRIFLNTIDTSYTDKEQNNSAYFYVDIEHAQWLQDTNEKKYIRIPIYNHESNGVKLFSMPPFYTHVKFTYKEEQENKDKRLFISNIIYHIDEDNAVLLTNNNTTWKLVYATQLWAINGNPTNKTLRDIASQDINTVTLESDGFYYINGKQTNLSIENFTAETLTASIVGQNKIEINENTSIIPTNLLDVICYIDIDYDWSNSEHSYLSDAQCYINFYRDFTADELEFAQIADQCPWLENKLIDFNYFKTANIISQNEYDTLMNIILNQLRRVNGSLMFYARGYYHALQERTKMLAELLNNLDSLGAACQAAVIDPIATTGKTSDDNRQYFENAYNLLINAPWKRKALLRYDDTVTDYFSKYFNSQQRFLKNIYNFRQYFDAPYISNISSLYGYRLIIQNNEEIQSNKETFYTFDSTIWNSVGSSFKEYAGAGADEEDDNPNVSNYGQPYYTIYRYNAENNQYVVAPIADKSQVNAGSLYKLPSIGAEGFYCDDTDTYKEIQYGQIVFDIPAIRVSHTANNETYYTYHLIDDEGPAIASKGSLKNYTGRQVFVGDFNEKSIVWDGLYYIRIGDFAHMICWADSFQLLNSTTGEGKVRFYQIRQGGDWNAPQDSILAAKPVRFLPYNQLIFGNHALTDSRDIALFDLHRIKARYVSDTFTSEDQYLCSDDFITTHIPLNITTKVVPASQQNIIENWILNQADVENGFDHIVKRTYPLYSQFPERKREDQQMADFTALTDIAKICYCSTLMTQNEDEDLRAKKVIDLGKDSDHRKIYYKNLPISELYQPNQPYLQIDKQTDENNKNIYYFKRLNQKGQSLTDYIKFLNTPLAERTQIVENPYDQNQKATIRIPYVTPENELNFYRRVYYYYWPSAELFPLPWLIMCLVNLNSPTWGTDKTGGYDVEGKILAHTYNGYYDYIDNVYENNSDKILPIYTVAEDTYAQLKEYDSAVDAAASLQGINWSSPLPKTIALNSWKDSYLKVPIENIHVYYNKNEHQEEITLQYSHASSFFNNFELLNYGYTFRDAPVNSLFIDTLYQPMKLSDKIYKNHKYAAIMIERDGCSPFFIQDNDDWKTNINNVMSSNADGLSAILYYPLINLAAPIDLTTIEWNKDRLNNGITVEDFLEASDALIDDTSDNYLIQLKDTDVRGYILFFNICDYNTEPMSILYNDAITNYSSKNKWYDKYTQNAFPFLSQAGVTKGFIRIPTVAENLIRTKAGDFDIESGVYYNADKQRVYTIKQLDNKYYYIKTTWKDYEYAQTDQREFPVTIVRNDKYWIDNAVYKIDKNILDNLFELDFSDATDVNQTIEGYTDWKEKTFVIGNEVITVQRGRTVEPVIDLKGLTNGGFWYFYHTNLDHPILFEQAAAIETQLTEYWTNAYYASKGCEYFLPEYWTETAQENNNTFNKNIYSVQNNVVTLSDQYIPEVLIYKPKENNSNAPMYRLYFRSTDALEEDYHQNDITDGSQLIHAQSVIKNNPAYYYAFERLMPEDPSEITHWVAKKIGQTTYYYVENINSGMLWEDFVGQSLRKMGAYQEMSGNYIMGYRLLRKNYYNSDFGQYLALQKEHDQIWKTLYENYGFLLLENSYKNDNATTSKDLLITSQLYFKDRKIPERAYNISVIDTSSLDNYEGAEIRIGDGIRINAKEYYDEYDLVYQSLSQYLFITDISYTLRNTADINLTVNSVKYEEGIIKRLAKLIK